MRKPNATVLSISGENISSVPVTDDDYQLAIQKQAAALQVLEEQRRVLDVIRTRLAAGAPDHGARYYFDFELGIVRRRGRSRAK